MDAVEAAVLGPNLLGTIGRHDLAPQHLREIDDSVEVRLLPDPVVHGDALPLHRVPETACTPARNDRHTDDLHASGVDAVDYALRSCDHGRRIGTTHDVIGALEEHDVRYILAGKHVAIHSRQPVRTCTACS